MGSAAGRPGTAKPSSTPDVGMLPAWLIASYIAVTVLIAVAGPVKYVGLNWWPVSLYMSTFLLILLVSFRAGMGIVPTVGRSVESNAGRRSRLMKHVRLCLWVSIFVYMIQLAEVAVTSPAALLPTNIGTNYLDFAEASGSYSLGILLRFVSAFLRSFGLIVGLFLYGEMQKSTRRLLISSLVLNLYANGIVSGTQSVFGHTVIYVGAILLLKQSRPTIVAQRKFWVWIGIGCVVSFAILTWIQLLRYDALGINVDNYYGRSTKQFFFDLEHPIFLIFGERWGFAVSILLGGYLVGGYQGLSFSLQLPFHWTYGLGSSRSLALLASWLGAPDVYQDTYLNRMEETFGRGGLTAWNTIFPWLASDYTFTGALLLFIPVGLVWGMSWREARQYGNPISALMFATIFLGLVFVPANNQLFHGIDGFISSAGIVISWVTLHTQYNGTARQADEDARGMSVVAGSRHAGNFPSGRTRERVLA